MVQNCPNRLSEATRSPFGSVVIWVSLGPTAGFAYSTGGKSTNGFDNGGYGVTICSDNGFVVEKCRCLPMTEFLEKLLLACGFNSENLKNSPSSRNN